MHSTLDQTGDVIKVSADISPASIKKGVAGRKQRILYDETREVVNSEGKILVITVKVATKPVGFGYEVTGQGLTGKRLGNLAPHRS